MLTWFWIANSVNYESVILILLVPSNATHLTWNSGKGKQRWENKAFILFIYSVFEITKFKLNSYLDNLIRFSVIYSFIRLCHEITEIHSIKLTENSTQTER